MITLFQDVLMIIAIVVLMLFLDWELALISFAILPGVIWVIREFRKRTRVLYREVRKQLAALNATLAEHISGQKIIQLFNQYFHKRDEFSRINREYFNTSLKQMKLFAFFRPIIHVSSQMRYLIIWYKSCETPSPSSADGPHGYHQAVSAHNDFENSMCCGARGADI